MDFEFDTALFAGDGGDPLLSWDLPDNYWEGLAANGSEFNAPFETGAAPDAVADPQFLEANTSEPQGDDAYRDEGHQYPDADSTQGSGGSPFNASRDQNSIISQVKQAGGGIADFLTKNKLWTPLLGVAAGTIDRAAQRKQQLEDEAKAKEARRQGVISGHGLSLWRSKAKAVQAQPTGA